MGRKIMIVFLIISAVLIILVAVSYIISIKPCNSRRERMKQFEKYYIAHRGLFNNKNVPENSMLAFANAVHHNFGIELDVQITKDGKLVVFHDKSLKRMCGIKKALYKMTYAELSGIYLLNTGERIPLFRDVLSLVAGKVPLIIEIKPEGDVLKTTELVNEMLYDYKGLYCIESFHPMVLKWLKENNPEILRGQLSTLYTKRLLDRPWFTRFLLSNLFTNIITSPDFIAYNHKYKNRLTYRICRFFYNIIIIYCNKIYR